MSLNFLDTLMCVCSVAPLCLSLGNPWTVAHQAPLSVGFPRQEYWNGLPFPTPGDILHAGVEPPSPALADSLPTESSEKTSQYREKVTL